MDNLTSARWEHRTLKANKTLVLAAVSNNGLALQFTSEDLQRDRKIAAAAVRQNKEAMQFVKDLQEEEVVLFARSNNIYTVISSID
jgi:hypothetical protein